MTSPTLGSDQDSEQDVAGETGQPKAPEHVTGNPGAEQGKADGERGAGRSGRDRTADRADPQHDDDREAQRSELLHSCASAGRHSAASNCEPMLPSTVAARIDARRRFHHRGRIESEGDAEDAWRQQRGADGVRNGHAGDATREPAAEELARDAKQEVRGRRGPGPIPKMSSWPRPPAA